MQPIRDWVLVKPEEKKTTQSGIIMPDDNTSPLKSGTVISVGSGICENGVSRALEVDLNDKILYKSYGALEVDVDGVKHLLMKEENIVAIL